MDRHSKYTIEKLWTQHKYPHTTIPLTVHNSIKRSNFKQPHNSIPRLNCNPLQKQLRIIIKQIKHQDNKGCTSHNQRQKNHQNGLWKAPPAPNTPKNLLLQQHLK